MACSYNSCWNGSEDDGWSGFMIFDGSVNATCPFDWEGLPLVALCSHLVTMSRFSSVTLSVVVVTCDFLFELPSVEVALGDAFPSSLLPEVLFLESLLLPFTPTSFVVVHVTSASVVCVNLISVIFFSLLYVISMAPSTFPLPETPENDVLFWPFSELEYV